MLSTVYDNLNSIMDRISPLKKIRISGKNRINIPWMSTELFKFRDQTKKLFKECRKLHSCDPKWESYRQQNKEYSKLKRDAKINNVKERLMKNKNSSKKLWATINTVIGKSNNKKNVISMITTDGKTITNDKAMAQSFCKYFSNIGTNMSKKLPNSSNKFYNSLKNIPKSKSSIFFQPYVEHDIIELINDLPDKTSSGWDRLDNTVLKSLKNSLCVPLCIMINESMLTGSFPELFKEATIIPLFKSKEKYLLNNYRPISLLTTMSKIFEKGVHIQMLNFLELHNVYYKHQYGFRSGHSTTQPVTELVCNVIKNNEEKKITGALFIDL